MVNMGTAKIKPIHICLYCGLFILALVGVFLYRSSRIDDNHPSFVKEFLDNPEKEESDTGITNALVAVNATVSGLSSKVGEMDVKMATIESVYSNLDDRITKNELKITTNANDLLVLKTTVDQASSELSDAASAEPDEDGT